MLRKKYYQSNQFASNICYLEHLSRSRNEKNTSTDTTTWAVMIFVEKRPTSGKAVDRHMALYHPLHLMIRIGHPCRDLKDA